jgi:hypothetical protein
MESQALASGPQAELAQIVNLAIAERERLVREREWEILRIALTVRENVTFVVPALSRVVNILRIG